MKIYNKIIWDADGNEVLSDWFDYSGPVSHAGGGSSKQTQQTSTGPWTVQQPYLAQGFSEAYKNYQSDSPQYYPDSTVTPFSDATNQGLSLTKGLADSSVLPGQAADQVGATTSGAYLRSPQDWASSFQNPAANNINPAANVRASTAYNPSANVGNASAGAFNPYAGVKGDVGSNPYMTQGPNGYADAVTNSISRSVIPQVTSQFAAAGRNGDSPIAQQAIAKGIADALAPYQFNSAEAEAGRRFSGGESLASRQQNSSESQAQRLYGSGATLAQQQYNSGEAKAGRQFSAGDAFTQGLNASAENQAQRQYGAGSELTGRQFTSGQNALTAGLGAYDAERQRQLTAANMAPGIDAARYAPADALLKAGSQEEQKSGQYTQDAIDRFNFGQNLPTQKLNDFMAQIQGNYGQAGTNITNASYQQPFAQTFSQVAGGLKGLTGTGGAMGK